MLDEISLKETDKLEMINYGLNPDLDYNNHGRFYMSKVLDRLQNGNSVIIFPGIEVEQEFWSVDGKNDSFLNMRMNFPQPYLFLSSEHNILRVVPFNPELHSYINRFSFDFKKFEIKALDDDQNTLSLKCDGNIIGIKELYEGDILKPQIAIPKKIEKSEIHKKYLEQVASMYNLSFGNYNEDSYGHFTQTFSVDNGETFNLVVEKRKSDMGYFPRDIIFEVDSKNKNLIKRLDKEANLSMYLEGKEKSVFRINSNFYQTQNLNKIMQIIIENSA